MVKRGWWALVCFCIGMTLGVIVGSWAAAPTITMLQVTPKRAIFTNG